MSDPYRISPAPEPTSGPEHTSRRQGLLRPVLWLVLILSAAANATTSTTDLNPLVGIAFGVVTLACVVTLIVHHYRHRD